MLRLWEKKGIILVLAELSKWQRQLYVMFFEFWLHKLGHFSATVILLLVSFLIIEKMQIYSQFESSKI